MGHRIHGKEISKDVPCLQTAGKKDLTKFTNLVPRSYDNYYSLIVAIKAKM